MSSRFNRRSSSPVLSLLTAALLLAGTPLTAAAAEPTARSHGNYSFSIEQQPLVSALNAFTAVTGWQVGLPAELGQGVSSPGVRGALSPEKALERLLVGDQPGLPQTRQQQHRPGKARWRRCPQPATGDHQRHP
ncbi:hypothetical protein ACVWZP_005293 [Pseudomonas sp. TE36184]